MIDFTINNNDYQIPGTWEELTSSQFVAIVQILDRFLQSEIDVFQCRVLVALELTGLKPKRFRSVEKATFLNENMYVISQQINFMLKFEYNNKKTFSSLNKEVRELLYRYSPDELPDSLTEKRWAKKQNIQVLPDFVFSKNLIPEIHSRRNKLKGYTFDLNGRLLECSLTAIQFIDAQRLSNEFFENGEVKTLDRLIATLYFPGKYNPDEVSTIVIPKITAEQKQAILYNFNAIQAFLVTRTKYNVLFSNPKPSLKKTEGMGLIGVVYSLTKAGYGNVDDMPLLKFFDIMYSDLINNINRLKDQGLTIDKISEAISLPISIINKLTS